MFGRFVHILVLTGFLFAQVIGVNAAPLGDQSPCPMMQSQMAGHIMDKGSDPVEFGDLAPIPAKACPRHVVKKCMTVSCVLTSTDINFDVMIQNVRHIYVGNKTMFGQVLIPDPRPPRV